MGTAAVDDCHAIVAVVSCTPVNPHLEPLCALSAVQGRDANKKLQVGHCKDHFQHVLLIRLCLYQPRSSITQQRRHLLALPAEGM
jgi:hypothetical protein